MFVQYRMFAVIVVSSCSVSVKSVLYIAYSGFLRVTISSASGHFEKQRPQVALNGTKSPRAFLLARCGTAGTRPEPDDV